MEAGRMPARPSKALKHELAVSGQILRPRGCRNASAELGAAVRTRNAMVVSSREWRMPGHFFGLRHGFKGLWTRRDSYD